MVEEPGAYLDPDEGSVTICFHKKATYTWWRPYEVSEYFTEYGHDYWVEGAVEEDPWIYIAPNELNRW
jgi:hypothetical protein